MLKSRNSTIFLSNQKLHFVFFVLLITAPILANYRFSDDLLLTIGDFLIVLLTPFLFLPNLTSDYLKLAKFTFLILTLFLVTVFVNVIDASQLKYFFYVALFFITISLKKNINIALQFFSLYSKIGCFLSIFLIFQFTNYYPFDVRSPFVLPLSIVEVDTLISLQSQFRPGSVFRESSYFVLFISPLVFYYSQTKQYYNYFLVIISALLSTSSLIIPIIILEKLNNFFNFKSNYKQIFFIFSE